MCPFFRDMAKSMCMRVTSEGRTAAPGPHFRLMSCEDREYDEQDRGVGTEVYAQPAAVS